MLSYWEKESLLEYHHIIVGSGIVGLSTAISLREKQPGRRVLVLERSLLPTGASTKNAGFACFGSLTELLDDLTTLREDEVLQLAALRWTGLSKLRARLGDAAIDYQLTGSYELIGEAEEEALSKLPFINRLLHQLCSEEVFEMADDKLKEFGFNPSQVKHLVLNRFEGNLNTGKMMRALLDKAMEVGVEIKTGCTVKEFNDLSSSATVSCESSGASITFTCQQLCFCTNAFTPAFFPQEDIRPGRGQVLITKALPALPFKGIFHFDKGFYYFRNVGNRILLGGGRNSDFKGEATTHLETTAAIQQLLEEKLRTLILPHTPFEVEQRWSGIMAFGKNKFPLLKRVSPRVLMGVRLGGMGVAIGSELGEQLAEMM